MLIRPLLLAALAVVLFAAGTGSAPHAEANGVPIRLSLSYLNGLSNWGPTDASGTAELSFAEAVIRLDARGLPALTGETYQIWLVKSGTNKATPVGAFNAPGGVAGYTGKLTGLDGYDYDLMIITVESVPDADPAPANRRSIGSFFTPVRKEEIAPGISSDVQPATLPNTGDPLPLPVAAPAKDDGTRHKLALMLFAIGGFSAFAAIKRKKRSPV